MLKSITFISILSSILIIMPPAMSSDTGQISPFRNPTRYITTHDQSSGKSILHSPPDQTTWNSLGNNSMGFSVPFTTSSFPVNMNDDTDIREHEDLVNSGKLGLVKPGGTVCRFVDIAPQNEPVMHRTVSLDYGIVIEGELEMILDSGVVTTLKRGDVAVQRGTVHGWRNPSKTEWARIVFVLQSSQEVVVNGKELGESVPDGSGIPPSQ